MRWTSCSLLPCGMHAPPHLPRLHSSMFPPPHSHTALFVLKIPEICIFKIEFLTIILWISWKHWLDDYFIQSSGMLYSSNFVNFSDLLLSMKDLCLYFWVSGTLSRWTRFHVHGCSIFFFFWTPTSSLKCLVIEIEIDIRLLPWWQPRTHSRE